MRLYFRDESHLYPKCLFDILTIYPKSHGFYFFSRGMRMYIPILTGVQNWHISPLKNSVFLLKNVPFEASFPWWRSLHLYANCLFCIPAIYPKCYRFHFFIRMHILNLTEVQNEPESHRKGSVFLLKNVLFEASFTWWRSLVCQLLALYYDYLF